MANDIDYVIWGPNGSIYFIPKDRMDEFKLDEESQTYQDISNDPVSKAMEVAAAVVDDNGDWQPIGASCIAMACGEVPEENQ
ncbi:MAG: hypothetical protein AAFQ07_17060, partial [Chloroflexota bacterium]